MYLTEVGTGLAVILHYNLSIKLNGYIYIDLTRRCGELTQASSNGYASCRRPRNYTLTAKDPKQQIWGISGGLLSGGLESGGLESGGLQGPSHRFRIWNRTLWGSRVWGSRVWGSRIPSYRFRIWSRTYLGV